MFEGEGLRDYVRVVCRSSTEGISMNFQILAPKNDGKCNVRSSQKAWFLDIKNTGFH